MVKGQDYRILNTDTSLSGKESEMDGKHTGVPDGNLYNHGYYLSRKYHTQIYKGPRMECDDYNSIDGDIGFEYHGTWQYFVR